MENVMDLYNNGERPGDIDPSSIVRSQNRYKTAIKFVKNSTVIDYGCGIGLGYPILKDMVKDYVGYDKCKEAAKEAWNRYPQGTFISYDIVKEFYENRLLSNPADRVLLGLEIIEHLEKEDLKSLLMMASESKLRCYFTTPDGDFYPYHPVTIEQRVGHHIWHYTYQELKHLFEKYFKYVDIFGLERDEILNRFVTFGIYSC